MQSLEVQFNCWEAAFEGKGLRVNMGKSKILECGTGKRLSVEAKIDPCDVCGRRAKTIYIRCKTCQKWVHARFVTVKKVTDRVDESMKQNTAKVDNLGQLDRVENFCY